MNKLRTLIIEDEEPARDLVKAYLKDNEHIELIGECADGFTGVKTINETKPDLVFLDIQMPKLTGFEMLELLDEMPEIVFTTAYDQFAIKAFELSAVDYLMKPFSKARFNEAIEKVLYRVQNKQPGAAKLQQLSQQAKETSTTKVERLFVKTGNKIDVIPVDTIIRVEAQDDYVEIHNEKGKFLKYDTMNFLEKCLPEDIFVRVHRSHIININLIEKMEKYGKDSYLIIMKDKSKVNVSKSRVKELKEQLGI
ncbi:MAG: DNA-binding response regulator [Bacteroidetes bacterium CG18_big_fil_WC_8_21_14_2_50_41_14]|nr:MAG: DNA-binding response regulator [Bacteroidetes bacterium CG18_big_fil_WC_8_21_14_2_50_41_14]PJB58728.1 MAG: DNA-binding response regulator [Bacteroidetes bacterium CG_4_9_14_3_um_filter_41_19]